MRPPLGFWREGTCATSPVERNAMGSPPSLSIVVEERGATEAVLRGYAAAWLAGDLEQVLGYYHEDFELHYLGQSPLAGSHRGRDAALDALSQATLRSSRRLVEVEDVLVGDSRGALVAIEELGEPPRQVRRILLYRVADGCLRECWLFDEDQRYVDQLWSRES